MLCSCERSSIYFIRQWPILGEIVRAAWWNDQLINHWLYERIENARLRSQIHWAIGQSIRRRARSVGMSELLEPKMTPLYQRSIHHTQQYEPLFVKTLPIWTRRWVGIWNWTRVRIWSWILSESEIDLNLNLYRRMNPNRNLNLNPYIHVHQVSTYVNLSLNLKISILYNI